MQDHGWVLEAFPSTLRAEAAAVSRRLPLFTSASPEAGVVTVAGEPLRIPYRLYSRGIRPDPSRDTPVEQRMLHCLGTRHHDGHTRERHLRAVVRDLSPWVVPYVVALVGEYVVEIVQVVEQSLTELTVAGSAQQRAYGSYLAPNPRVLQVTRSRVVSYWDSSHRSSWPTLAEYPGQRLAKALQVAAQA
ncbi:hypothetical protein GCU67_07455 [Modestobacter muralis]|uniref:Uncharacterized protein n=1 Tax=Modestobacter muralis TaxID=1608614 RepID=A0A6P0H4U7_9ACTN|nr:hypothetical protein [Modestobacter muralis]NEK94010.1 hypothetical protein [Modestobacter muralis]NEN50777.1 hypothetical protein [Modestobacter muralis]